MLDTLLLVDDSDVDLLFTSVIIERSGIATAGLQFESAAQALEFLRGPDAARVDAILLDINMPVMNGFDFLAVYEPMWQSRQSRAIVVMLTSSPDPLDRARAGAFGCVRDYVLKPLDIKSALGLAARVQRAVDDERRR